MTEFLKIICDNAKAILTGDYEVGNADLNTLCNLALMRIDRKTVTPSLKGIRRLTRKQRKAVRKFYHPYVRHITDRYHRIYTEKSGGRFYPEYLPEELYAISVDRYFSDRKEARYLDNKCYYYRLFSHVKQPELVAMRIGGSWLDERLELIDFKDVLRRIKKEEEIVVKQAVNSEGGFGVAFLSGEERKEQLKEKLRQIRTDVVIQRPVRQHPELAALHPESVNTLRIVSLLTKDQVKIYAVSLKIGVGKARVDNGCHGGIYCGVRPDGRLGKVGMLDNGTVLYQHPDGGYRFEDKQVPCLEHAYELVKKAHAFMGHFRLISWDVAIDEKGEAVLIEANLSLGGINDVQICNGPLFGADTKKLLDEVFCHRKKQWTAWF